MIKAGRIKTEKEDIAEFFSDLENIEITFEASSNYEYFYDLLESLGHKVVLAHPLKAKIIAEAKIKTDKRGGNQRDTASGSCRGHRRTAAEEIHEL